MLAALLRLAPTGGTIKLAGIVNDAVSLAKLRSSAVSVIPQDPVLFRYMHAAHHVAIGTWGGIWPFLCVFDVGSPDKYINAHAWCTDVGGGGAMFLNSAIFEQFWGA